MSGKLDGVRFLARGICVGLIGIGGAVWADAYIWQGASGGVWSVADNWQGGAVPNVAGATVDLSAASGTYAITLDSAVTVGKITLADGVTTDLTLSGAKLTFAGADKPELHLGTGRTLRLNTTATGGTQGLRKTGAGTFLPKMTSAGNTFGGGLTVEAGAVKTVKNGKDNHWCGTVDVRSGATFNVQASDTLSNGFGFNANGGTVEFGTGNVIDYAGPFTFANDGLVTKAALAFINNEAVAKLTATGTGFAGTFDGCLGATSRYSDNAAKVAPYRTVQVSVADMAAFAMTGTIVDNRLQGRTYGNNIFHAETASDIPYAGQLTKVGNGDLVLHNEEISLTGPTKVEAGRLVLSNAVTMTASAIRLAAGVDQLVLRAGATLKLGGLTCTAAGDLDLGGNAIDLGGTAEDATFPGTLKNGTIRKVGNNTQTVGALAGQASVDVLGGTLAVGFPRPRVRYAFDNAADLGRDSGAAGIALQAPASGVAYAADGKSGGCANFSGGTLSAATAAGLPGGNAACTLMAWVKPTAVGGIIAWGNPTSGKRNYNSLFFSAANQLKHTFWGGCDAFSDRQPNAFTDGTWRHVAFTYNPGTRQQTFYVNGVAAGATNYTGVADVVLTNKLQLGTGMYAGVFKGKMDEVMVFDCVLSPEQIVRASQWDALADAAAMPDGGAVRIERDATLALSSAKLSPASISGAGTLELAENAEVTLASDGATSLGRLAGAGTLVKRGAGTLTLNQARGLGGNLTVAAGTVSAVAPRADEAITSHLKAWWNFNDRDNPGADASGNGLTVRSYVAPGTGNSSGETYPWRNRFTTTGGAAWFDGVNNHHLELVNSNDVAKLPVGASSFTTACWFNPAANCSTSGGLVYWGNGVCVSPTASRHCNGLRFASATTLYHFFWSADLTTPDLGDIRAGDAPDGWHHVAVTYDAATGKRIIYYDGEAKKTDTQTGIDVQAGEFRIGMTLGYQRTFQNFTGYLDDVMIFDTALTAAEVKSIMRGFATTNAATCAVNVASGATFVATEGAVSVGRVAGAGTLSIADGATLTVTETADAAFTGAVTGAGTLAFGEGMIWLVTGETPTALWTASTAVTLPRQAHVAITLPAGVRNVTAKLVESSVGLSGDVSAWTASVIVGGKSRSRWRVEPLVDGNTLYVTASAPGLCIIVK